MVFLLEELGSILLYFLLGELLVFGGQNILWHHNTTFRRRAEAAASVFGRCGIFQPWTEVHLTSWSPDTLPFNMHMSMLVGNQWQSGFHWKIWTSLGKRPLLNLNFEVSYQTVLSNKSALGKTSKAEFASSILSPFSNAPVCILPLSIQSEQKASSQDDPRFNGKDSPMSHPVVSKKDIKNARHTDIKKSNSSLAG